MNFDQRILVQVMCVDTRLSVYRRRVGSHRYRLSSLWWVHSADESRGVRLLPLLCVYVCVSKGEVLNSFFIKANRPNGEGSDHMRPLLPSWCMPVSFYQTLLIKHSHFLNHIPSVLKQWGGEMRTWPETTVKKTGLEKLRQTNRQTDWKRQRHKAG